MPDRSRAEKLRAVISVLKWVPWALGLILAVVVVALLSYYLPSARKVHIVDTEVKRMDGASEGKTDAVSRDVRFIYAKDAESGKSLAYRNEDTRWGFPFYFKFNSGDIAAEAASIRETDPDATVLIISYGWRLTFVDAFPNVIKLRVVAPEYTHIPIFKILVLAFLAIVVGAFVFGVMKLRGRFQKSGDPT